MSKKIAEGFEVKIALGDGGSVAHQFRVGTPVVDAVSHIIKYSALSYEELDVLAEVVQDAIDKKHKD